MAEALNKKDDPQRIQQHLDVAAVTAENGGSSSVLVKATGRVPFVPRRLWVQNPSASDLLIRPAGTDWRGSLIAPKESATVLPWIWSTLNTYAVQALDTVTAESPVTMLFTTEEIPLGSYALPNLTGGDV